MMRANIPIGIDNFGELVDKENRYHFADKSLFIKEIIDDKSKVTLITRPRRWGKTLNLSMLQHFFADEVFGRVTQGIFDDLLIAKIDNGAYLLEQGQYPVISLTLKQVEKNTFSGAMTMMLDLLKSLYREHEYLLESEWLGQSAKLELSHYLSGKVNEAMLSSSLLFLSECLAKHHKINVYILIDEYDAPLNSAYEHGYLDDMTLFIKSLFSAALKGNPYLKKGVMTGILRISKDSLLSGLNNLNVFSMFDERYSSYFGFNDEEIEKLFSDCEISCEIEKVREYYNGYRIASLSLYNPWSVMQCLDRNGELSAYWINTGGDKLLRELMLGAKASIKNQVVQLISDEAHVVETVISDTIRFQDIVSGDGDLWSFLVATGYLTPLSVGRCSFSLDYVCRLAIPNREIRALYVKIFQNWLLDKIDYADYQKFLQDLLQGRVEDFTRKLSGYLLAYGSYYDFPQESNYHTFMLGLLCSLTGDYWLFSNTEAGEGRADIILVPKDQNQHSSIILEFKHHKAQPTSELALAALNQIQTKHYDAFMMRYQTIEKVLKIALVFSGKHVVSAYRWDNLDGMTLEQPVVIE